MRYARHSKQGPAGRLRRAMRSRGGFTLLELLVAMTILSIIGAAAFTMFRQSTGLYRRTTARTLQYVAAREALSLIATELRQARVLPNAAVGTDVGAFWGYQHEVYFVAPTATRQENSDQDLCVIGYWLTNDGKDETPEELRRYCLTDQDTGWKTLPQPSPSDLSAHSQPLGVLVRSLKFEYWPAGDTSDDTWDDAKKDTWLSRNEQDKLPRAVRITLVVADPSDPLADPTTGKNKLDRTFTTVVYMNNSSED